MHRISAAQAYNAGMAFKCHARMPEYLLVCFAHLLRLPVRCECCKGVSSIACCATGQGTCLTHVAVDLVPLTVSQL